MYTDILTGIYSDILSGIHSTIFLAFYMASILTCYLAIRNINPLNNSTKVTQRSTNQWAPH